MVDGFVLLGIIVTKKDVFVGGIDVLDIGLLEDSFGFPSKRYEGDDLEVATDEGVGTRRRVKDVVARMVMAVSEVNSNAGLRDVVDVQVQLGR